MESIVVTVSGYHGSERMRLIQLINHVGANYVGKMSRSTTHLVGTSPAMVVKALQMDIRTRCYDFQICWKFQGRKYELAKKFGTMILNHRWLEDCFKEGKRISEHPYSLQSGKEVGSLLNLRVLTERAGLLTENNLLSKKPKMLECLNEVIDLDSDDIENDDWDDDWLLDENLFPRSGIRDIAPQRSKRKLGRETPVEDWQPKAHQRRPIREPQIPTIDRRQGTGVNRVRVGLAESSHRSRRLVLKNAERNINGSATVDVEQQSRRKTDVGDLGSPSSLSNSSIDFRDDIEASNKKESTCPLCKASFASITRVDGAASLDQKIYSQFIPDPSSTQDIFIVPEGGAGPPDTEVISLLIINTNMESFSYIIVRH
ncbi:hypothetical protein Cgig2_002116 [Carnegiea gigantea]|uniref:BRCT domain-containing protein n=1 Tax=Carnegiea gigantea TaxID=171969 RepID=A0A9Q1KT38_9CARY|nr:hypothetical protein Cgig2_002116 [Carnegiea gigantea]